MPLRRPPALQPGDRVAVLSASSPADAACLPDGLDALRFAGLEPVVYATAHDRGSVRHYLAGTDEARAADLRAALCDDSIAGIVFATGGYGAQRTLEAMDWSGMDRLAPKVLAGYSDVTALLEAVATRLGWSSLMCSMVSGRDFAEAYTFSSIVRCLMAPERAREFAYSGTETIAGGRARGVTVGGNLSLIASSLATDTCRPAAGGIVLLEDEDEDDARIDGMITQLRRSGYLDGVAGVICGAWARCGPREQVHAVLADRFGDLGVPVLAWANVGHGGRSQAFPLGVEAELDADAATLRFTEPPLVPTQR